MSAWGRFRAGAEPVKGTSPGDCLRVGFSGFEQCMNHSIHRDKPSCDYAELWRINQCVDICGCVSGKSNVPNGKSGRLL